MLVATWNVNSVRARLPRLLEMIERHAPDVLLLQETKCSAERFPRAELARAGYSVADHSGGRWAGVAILTRDGLVVDDVVHGLPGEAATAQARWLEADVAGGRFISVYVPNARLGGSPAFDEKLAFLEAMAARLGVLAADGARLVVAGDMNVCPADIEPGDAALPYAPDVVAAERERHAAVLEAGELVDAFRVLTDGPGFVCWDQVLLSRSIADRVLACGVDRDFRRGPGPSDHAPLLTRLSGSL